jgi:acyl carrier protein
MVSEERSMDVMTPKPVGPSPGGLVASRVGGRPAEPPFTGPVLRVWRGVLNVEVDSRANFFDLGGTALEAVLVVSRVSTQFGVELPLSSVFDYPTVAEFAAALAVHVDSADRSRRSDR